jgi:hypothetical protein
LRESAKAKPAEKVEIAKCRSRLRYPEFPKGIVLHEGVWDRKGEEPVNR